MLRAPGRSLKSRKIFALANSPKVPLALSVITSGTSFLTSRVRSAVSGSAGLSTTTRMSGVGLLELVRQVLEVRLGLGLELEERDDGAPVTARAAGERRRHQGEDTGDGREPEAFGRTWPAPRA